MATIKLHVVVPITTPGFRDSADFSSLFDAGIEVTQSQIEHGPASIECEYDEALAAPDTVAKALAAQEGGADAVIIDCMGDPGMEAAREVLSIPVLGPCQTSMHLAAMLGHRFSVLTVLERLAPFFEVRADRYGIGGKMASVRAVDIPVLDLDRDRDQMVKTLTEQGVLAIERDKAHALVFGCTGMLGCADELSASLADAGYHDVPVIDPMPATLRIAAAVVASGLGHSKRTYPTPPVKERIA